jgi:medium-chain acyl-[acyl-carrier-protein] hydrolase
MSVRGISPSTSWLVKVIAPPAATARIVAFPNAGGTASAFRAWGSFLPNDYELLAVQLPGRQKRAGEKPLRELGAAVEQMFPEIAALPPCRTKFLGDCAGSLIAYEVIRVAAARGLPLPEHLVVSCCRAPHVGQRRRNLHTLSEHELIADITALSLAPAWLLHDADNLRDFLPLLRADYELAETYRHQEGSPIDVPITAVAAAEDKVALREDVAAWRRHTSSEFTLLDIDGGGHDLATRHPEFFLPLMLERRS